MTLYLRCVKNQKSTNQELIRSRHSRKGGTKILPVPEARLTATGQDNS